MPLYPIHGGSTVSSAVRAALLLLGALCLQSSAALGTIKGYSFQICASSEDEARRAVLDKIQSDGSLCQAGEVPQQTGGWTCKRARVRGCGHSFACNTQYQCMSGGMEDTGAQAAGENSETEPPPTEAPSQPETPAAQSTAEAPTQAAAPPEAQSELSSKAEKMKKFMEPCEPYNSKLRTCEPFDCVMGADTPKPWKKKIFGKEPDGKCKTTEEIVGYMRTDCLYPPEILGPLADELDAMKAAKKTKVSVGISASGSAKVESSPSTQISNQTLQDGTCQMTQLKK